MRYGVCLPPFGELGEPSVLVELARATETAGWDGFFLWDHILWRRPVAIADCWVTLGAIALATDRVSIGPLVAAIPRRRPWKVAREVTTLDRLSNGRVVLGAGLGAPAEEFEPFGEPWDARVRAERLDEGLAIIAMSWAGPIVHEGQHFRVTDARFEPQPVNGSIPVWIGGYWPNRAPMRRAARWQGVVPRRRGDADGAPPRSLTAEEFAECVAFVSELRTASGAEGPFDYVGWGETDERDADGAAEHVGEYQAAGATWWIESTPSPLTSVADTLRVIERGPPRSPYRRSDEEGRLAGTGT
jgi:alkanesulfonate monooxygenase SsuD/methylene tetrahydromethanopterin reductase-like flavin-dependent oxidoreductase (luciferase family)